MRTVAENYESSREYHYMGNVPFVNEKDDFYPHCFYELGKEKVAILGGYSDRKPSELIKWIREYSDKCVKKRIKK